MEDFNDVETTEPAMEVADDAVENTIDDMSDEDFAKEFDDNDIDTISNSNDDNDIVIDDADTLDDLYSSQLNDTDAKLDKPVFIKVDGEVMKITTVNDLRNMAERGTSVTKKFQKLADDRRQLEEQLRELNVEPNVADETNEVDTIADNILNSSYADTFKAHIGVLPTEAKEMLSSDPRMLFGLSQDYESGLAQKIMPDVKREMTIKGINFLDAYVSVGNRVNAKRENVTAKQNVLKSEPKRNSYQQSAPDVNNMSDDDFDKYFANL